MKILYVLLFTVFLIRAAAQTPDHNCRMWGMITESYFDNAMIRNSLDGLQQLAASNPTGWGIGFFTETMKGNEIPAIYRGMWRADQDTQFDDASEMLINNIAKSGLAHVRNASTGYVNIPGPHPFYTKAFHRDFEMMFAHNGTLSVSKLKTLVDSYSDYNHYGYALNDNVAEPNLDSDLYRLFIMKWIDEHPVDCISKCLIDALTILIAEIGNNYSYNFILAAKGDTLWALRNNNSLSYRFTASPFGNTWEVASEPLGGSDWISATNHCLYAFTTGHPKPVEHFLSYYSTDPGSRQPPQNDLINVSFNTTGQSLEMEFRTDNRNEIVIGLFNSSGQKVEDIYKKTTDKGIHHFTFCMRHLPSGIYFVEISSDQKNQGKMIIKP